MSGSMRSAACGLSLLVLGAGVLAAWQTPARDAAPTPSVGTAAIAGTLVLDEPNGAPVRRATVTLSAAGMLLSRTTAQKPKLRMRISFNCGRMPTRRFPF